MNDLPGNLDLCNVVSQDSIKIQENCLFCIYGCKCKDLCYCHKYDKYFDFDRARYCDSYKKEFNKGT